MESKKCNDCSIEKNLCYFHKWKYGPDGYRRICKECRKKETKKYYENNSKKIKSTVSEYRKKNPEKVKEVKKKIYERNKDNILKTNKIYRENNKEKLIESRKKYLLENSEKIKEIKKKYYQNNLEHCTIKNKVYRENNKEKRNEYQRIRKLNDPVFKLNHLIRSRMNNFIKVNKIRKNNSTFNIVGCTPKKLREYIENQFTEGMCWEKLGKEIHIDHIIPLSSAKTESELYKLFHFSNLQPLWAKDNMKKGAKIIPQK